MVSPGVAHVFERWSLTEDENSRMLKLLWLLGQVDERARSRALRRVTPLLKRRDVGKDEFFRIVLEVTHDLEKAHGDREYGGLSTSRVAASTGLSAQVS